MAQTKQYQLTSTQPFFGSIWILSYSEKLDMSFRFGFLFEFTVAGFGLKEKKKLCRLNEDKCDGKTS